MKSYLIAVISTLVLSASVAHANSNTGSGPAANRGNCPPGSTCGFNARAHTHGHHAKIKPGQIYESEGTKVNPGQKSSKLDANTWPGPHPSFRVGGTAAVRAGERAGQ